MHIHTLHCYFTLTFFVTELIFVTDEYLGEQDIQIKYRIVKGILHLIKDQKSPGIDRIFNEFFKYIGNRFITEMVVLL